MSGHSKWATIKHKKGAADARRGRLFSRLAKEIIVAARSGGDPDMNPRLRRAIQDAKAVNMPSANIDRAVKRGTGELEGATYEEVVYEAYAPGGVALLIEILTDNKNRTAAEIRGIFHRRGGNLASAGAVSWIFEKKGLVRVDRKKVQEEALFTIATDAGADDFRTESDAYEVVTPVESFEALREALRAAKIEPDLATITHVPKSTVRVEDEKEAHGVLGLISALEEHDDVQNVYANFDIPDEILASAS